LTVTIGCREGVDGVAGAREAAARPAIATSRANMRIAEFIFGNLIELELGENRLSLCRKSIVDFCVNSGFS
jgi:hypothetical protein